MSDAGEHLAEVALGGNLGPTAEVFERALALLDADPGVRVLRCSAPERTRAWGPPQPDYLNAVALLATRYPPEVLLALLHRVERRLGRTAHRRRWSARVLDLDLLSFADWRVERARLTLPHPARERAFLARALSELSD